MAESDGAGAVPADDKTPEELQAEIEELRAELAVSQGRARTRIRGVASFILVILTAVSVTAAALGWWVHYVVFDTEAFMGVVEPAITSDEFTDALGARLGEEAVTALDLETRLETRLTAVDEFLAEQLIEALDLGPRATDIIANLNVPRFAELAGPLSQAANTRIEGAIVSLVSSDAFSNTLVTAITRGHEATIALVRDDLDSLENVYIEDGNVRWNSLPLLLATIEHVIEQGLLDGEDVTLPSLEDNPTVAAALDRISEALGFQVPDDLGQITVMTTEDLTTLQGYGTAFDRGVWLLTALALVLVAITIAVSPRRRRTLIQLGVATAISIVLAALATRAAVDAIQERIVSPQGRAAAGSVLAEVQGSVQAVGIAVFVIAVLVAVVAWLAGRPEQIQKWTEAARRATDTGSEPNQVDVFVGRHFDALAVAAVVLALVIVWLVDLTWLSGLVILALLGGLLWYGMAARTRYELDRGIDEIIEEDTVPVASSILDPPGP
ncbi:MAG TPA: hypothetical protein VI141_05100 [Acidimicrobiia bacterium]